MNRKEEYQDERWKARAAEIRKLDNKRCAMCGKDCGELHVHHLSYPPPPFHIWDSTDNELVTLCPECHKRAHKCKERPQLSKHRELKFPHSYTLDNFGRRIIPDYLNIELTKRGYTGIVSTQNVIDWLREEHWIYIYFKPKCVYEHPTSERACGYKVIAEIITIRDDCAWEVYTEDNEREPTEFDDYGEAEIGAIRFAIYNLLYKP